LLLLFGYVSIIIIIIIITAVDVVLAPGPPAAAEVATARHLLTGFAALAILGSICS
jgi:hypothetical protein